LYPVITVKGNKAQAEAIREECRVVLEDTLKLTLNMDSSVGSVGDSYDNALAETINGLYKTEVIRRREVLRRILKLWNTQPWNGWTGSIIVGFWNRLAMYHQQNTK